MAYIIFSDVYVVVINEQSSNIAGKAAVFNRELLYYHRALELVKENFPQQLQDHTFHDLKKVPQISCLVSNRI